MLFRSDDNFFNWLENLPETDKPLFSVVLGDNTDTGVEYDEYAVFQSKLASYTPVYNILGNHDILNNGYSKWKEVCTPHNTYYKLETKNLSFYILDTANGTIGNKQLNDMKRHFNSDNKPKIVLTHYPLKGDNIFYFALTNTVERAKLIDLFAKTNVKYYFGGHYHPGSTYDYGNFKEYILTAAKKNSWVLVNIDETNPSNPIIEIIEHKPN